VSQIARRIQRRSRFLEVPAVPGGRTLDGRGLGRDFHAVASHGIDPASRAGHRSGSCSIRMPVMTNFLSHRESAIIGLLFFLVPFMTLLAPLTTVPAIILLAGVSIGVAVFHGQSVKELLRFDLALALFAVVTLYLLINASWAADVPGALNKVLWFALVVIMSFAASRALGRWNERQINAAVIAFLAGMILGLGFILLELATHQALTRLLFNGLPALRPSSLKTLQLEGGKIVKIAPFELNRNVAVMLLMLWPALLCLLRLTDGRRRIIAVSLLFVAAVVAIFLSKHETSKLGLIVGVVAFLAAWFWPRAARLAMVALWCLTFVLVVPLASELAKDHLEQTRWLPYSARSRITLWAYTAAKIPDAPLLGIGLTSTRTLSSERTSARREEPLAEDKNDSRKLVWKTGPHSHNEFLQTWYELGAVGAILLLTTGCAVILSIGRLSPAIQPFMLAQFAGFFVMAGFSWGMWQSWLMALPGLTVLYAALAASFATAEQPITGKYTHAAPSRLASRERPA
jgi:O-antigen ligase